MADIMLFLHLTSNLFKKNRLISLVHLYHFINPGDSKAILKEFVHSLMDHNSHAIQDIYMITHSRKRKKA